MLRQLDIHSLNSICRRAARAQIIIATAVLLLIPFGCAPPLAGAA